MPVSGGGGANRPDLTQGQTISEFKSPGGAQSPAQTEAALNARRNLAGVAQKNQAQTDQKQQADQPQEEQDKSELKLRHYLVLFVVCGLQDLVPLVADLLGIGWLLAYITVIPVVAIYLYFVMSLSPRRMRGKLLRGLFIGAAELIPVLGEILPGWTTLAFYFYIMTSRDARTAPLRAGIEAKEGGATVKSGAVGAAAKTGK